MEYLFTSFFCVIDDMTLELYGIFQMPLSQRSPPKTNAKNGYLEQRLDKVKRMNGASEQMDRVTLGLGHRAAPESGRHA
ncbi:hypothetical protein TURU_008405 [Turdus rufiventris]|nr:hypothetical protein TURU_008405 [Turdus rufiventris]